VEKLTDRRVNSRPELGNPNSLHAIDDEGLCAPVDLRFARQEHSLIETHDVRLHQEHPCDLQLYKRPATLADFERCIQTHNKSTRKYLARWS
jgi:hypothetical protein